MDPILRYVLKSPMTWWAMTPIIVVMCLTVLAYQWPVESPFVDTVSIAMLALAFVLMVLAVFFQAAPSSITSREVKWANFCAPSIYTASVTFEEVAFIHPLLTRVAAYSGDGRRLRAGELQSLKA